MGLWHKPPFDWWLSKVCWLPAATLVGFMLWLSQYDGWGAWAAAPLLLVPLALSAGLGFAGLFGLWTRRRASRLWAHVLVWLLTISPILWFVVRAVLRSMRQSSI